MPIDWAAASNGFLAGLVSAVPISAIVTYFASRDLARVRHKHEQELAELRAELQKSVNRDVESLKSALAAASGTRLRQLQAEIDSRREEHMVVLRNELLREQQAQIERLRVDLAVEEERRLLRDSVAPRGIQAHQLGSL